MHQSLLLLLLLAVIAVRLPAADLAVGANVALCSAYPNDMCNEVYLAADPGDDRRLIASSYVAHGAAGAGWAKLLIYRSGDGGASWSTDTRLLAEPGSLDCDPMPYWTAQRRALFSGISTQANLVHFSDDGGANWTRSNAPRSGDHLRLAPDPRPGSRRVWAVYCNNNGSLHEMKLARSDDDGASFGAFASVPGIGSAQAWVLNTNKPLVFSDGTLLLPYREWDLTVPMTVDGRVALKCVRTSDGVSFDTPTMAANIHDPYEPAVQNEKNRRTFQDGFYRPSLGTRAGYSPISAWTAARAGTWRDRLYVVYEQCEGYSSAAERLRTRIWIAHSDDQGRNWSAPRRIEATPPATSRQGHPDVAVSGDGSVLVAWADTRGYEEADPTGASPADPYRFRVWAAVSVDGGASFAPAQALSSQVSQPDFWNRFGYQWNWDLGWGHFGDETGLIAGGQGARFHAAWPDGRTGMAQPMYASVQLRLPSCLRASAVAGGIALAWNDNSADESGFRIERWEGGAWVQRAQVTAGATTWTDSGLTAGSLWRYRVRAILPGGDSAPSNEVQASPAAPVNQAPTVSLSAPAGGSSYASGATVVLQASAADADGSVVKVEFLVDGTTVGEDTSVPFALNWTAAPGSHSLSARATDNLGLSTTSMAVAISVAAPPPVPPATPATPNVSNGTSATPTLSGITAAGATLRIYDGATLLGTVTADSTGAWSFTTPTLAVGPHSLNVTASNAAGSSAPSAPVVVQVAAPAPGGTAPVSVSGTGGGAACGVGSANATILAALLMLLPLRWRSRC